MERDEKREAPELKPPRMLNLDTPLLSTKRLGVSVSRSTPCINSQGTSDRIPFSWEQAPGRPKNLQRCVDVPADSSLEHPPKWRHPWNDVDGNRDDGCDGDVEDGFFNEDDDHDGSFLDAMDMFSLSEAIDYIEKTSKAQKLDKLKLKSLESRNNESANFMIERFLPDATALTQSSSTLSSHLNKNSYLFKYPEKSVSVSQSRSESLSQVSRRGCGLETIFRWHIKNHICGVKRAATSVQIQCHIKRERHSSSVKRTIARPSNKT